MLAIDVSFDKMTSPIRNECDCMKRISVFFFCILTVIPGSLAESNPTAETPTDSTFQFRRISIDDKFPMGYQIKVADINTDGKLDVIALREGDDGLVAWYENPSWTSHRITPPTVIRPISMEISDIDGDDDLDIALAHDFDFNDSVEKGMVSWLEQGSDKNALWIPHLIDKEPMQHRLIWIDMDGDGKDELVSSPLLGVNATPSDFLKYPVRIKMSRVPDDPKASPWLTTVLYDKLHAIHGLMKVPDGVGKMGRVFTASYEGISILSLKDSKTDCTLWHEGSRKIEANHGSSEIALGAIGDETFYAAIEPRHGNEVAVYRGASTDLISVKPKRTVIDDRLQVGHGVHCADINQDGISEILAGDRGNNKSYYLFYATDRQASSWKKMTLDAGGMAGASCAVGDLDGDSDLDIVAVGSSTGNICLYENLMKP